MAALLALAQLPLLAACRAPESAQPLPLPVAAEKVQLGAGEVHTYQLGTLAAGEGLGLHLHQQGLDLVAEILDPQGRILRRIDGPSGDWGPEILCFLAPADGPYALRLAALSAARPGAYTLEKATREAPASPRLRACEAAGLRFAEARQAAREVPPAAGADALFEEAIAHWREAREPFGLALSLKEAGAFAARQGQPALALARYREAIAALENAGPENDLRQLAALYNYLGVAQGLSGESELARAAHQHSRELARAASDRRAEAAAISNLALASAAAGELHAAVELQHQALALWQQLASAGEDVAASEATTRNVLGGTLTQLGRFDLARDQLEKALALRQALGHPEPLANSYLALGWAEHLAGQGERAALHLEAAIGLYQKVHAAAGEAAARDRLGSVYAALGRPAEARASFEKSLAYYDSEKSPLHRAHVAANLGCLLLDRVLLASAAATFEKSGDRAAAAHVAFCRARLERQEGQLEAALAASEAALAAIDQLRAAALRQGYPGPTLDLWQRYEELEVDLLMELERRHAGQGYAARAFSRSDLTRARRLYEMLLEAEVEVRAEAPAALLAAEEQAQRRVGEAEQRRLTLAQQDDGSPGSAAAIAATARELRQRLAELEAAQAALRAASPRFAALRQPEALELAELQQLLEEGTVLLSYVFGEEHSYLFVVTRDRLTTRELPPRARIDALAYRVYEGLRSSRQRRVRLQLPQVAAELSEVLLAPARDLLAGRRLLVVGEGLLHYVPFAALPFPGAAGEGESLVEQFEVVHLPSAAVMKALEAREKARPKPPKELAVLAAAVYQGPGQEPGEWSDLPHTAEEAKAILELVPPEKSLAALGFAAKPELVREGHLAAYRILHFATHGKVDEENPELSGVALSMWDEEGHPRDGSLRLHEIYNLDLPADLVVLSACNTALTPKAQGAGLVGLTHGFFYAGASRLLVSLWDVDDEATAKLMELFYRGLLVEKLKPAEALRQAQRELKKNERFGAAYYWAGFVLEGSWK